jgi:hypothetical protein
MKLSMDHCLTPEIIINRKQSKLKKQKKINKINSEVEIIVHTPFTGLGDHMMGMNFENRVVLK